MIYEVQSRTHTNYIFNPPKTFFPNASNNCFIGIYYLTWLSISVGLNHITLGISNNLVGPTLYTASTNPNMLYGNVMICLSRCLETEFPDYSAGNGTCSPCSKLMANCYSCNSTGHCLTCMPGYFMLNTPVNKTCVHCMSLCLDC